MVFTACSEPRTKIPQSGNFGKSFSIKDAISIDSAIVNQNFGSNQIVYGIIDQYCKSEGCWLTLQTKTNKIVLVKIKHKAFVLPINISGKQVFINGELALSNHKKYSYLMNATGIIIK